MRYFYMYKGEYGIYTIRLNNTTLSNYGGRFHLVQRRL